MLKKAFTEKKGLMEIIEREGVKQITDSAAIEKAVDEVLRSNKKQAEEYQSGKSKVLGYLVGEVMKATRGKANPGMVNEMIRKKLGK